jgi:hypothetical protein
MLATSETDLTLQRRSLHPLRVQMVVPEGIGKSFLIKAISTKLSRENQKLILTDLQQRQRSLSNTPPKAYQPHVGNIVLLQQ